MESLTAIIIGFVLCATLITYSGTRLSKYGDIIAELTGMGKSWMGLIVIDVGNLLGSNIFNMLVLALNDLLYTKGELLLTLILTIY